MSRLDSMHTFISRTIIIVIPLSMRQSYAVVVIVIIIVTVSGNIIVIVIFNVNKIIQVAVVKQKSYCVLVQ